jgi:hypothetical protein
MMTTNDDDDDDDDDDEEEEKKERKRQATMTMTMRYSFVRLFQCHRPWLTDAVKQTAITRRQQNERGK